MALRPPRPGERAKSMAESALGQNETLGQVFSDVIMTVPGVLQLWLTLNQTLWASCGPLQNMYLVHVCISLSKTYF